MLLSRPAACVVSQEHGDLALPTGARALPHDARPMLLSGHPESRIWTLSRPRPEAWPLQVHARVTASPTVDNGHDSAWSIAAPCPPLTQPNTPGASPRRPARPPRLHEVCCKPLRLYRLASGAVPW
ncbi:hypothetical protein AcV5_007897 [Taiwanofungus camphoratus]|nr:hypothetical protein AcV5_007897 [Antrodia cinnamomea]